MASTTAIPSDTKTRIIKHMNADHQDSLVLYLQHYSHLSSFAARHAKLEDVSLTSLSITTGGGTLYTVPFDPPLASALDLRPRVVAMDQQARAALGRDAVTVTKYIPPHGIGAVFAGWAFFNLVTMTYPPNFLPGSWLYDNAYKYSPAFANLSYVLAPYVWWFIVICHGAEAAFLLSPRLRKHSVPFGSALWFKWIASDFFLDGIGTIRRFDKHVAAEKQKKDAKQH